jgi:hypothetical protein
MTLETVEIAHEVTEERMVTAAGILLETGDVLH